jgi:hypothetical protein
VCVAYSFVDSRYGGCPSKSGAENCITSATLGTGVHLLPVLLIDEGDSDKLCEVTEVWVSVIKGHFIFCAKEDGRQGEEFCFTRDWGLAELAGPHSEEEGSADDVGCMGKCRAGIAGISIVVKFSEELWGYSSLATRGGVASVEGSKERTDGG